MYLFEVSLAMRSRRSLLAVTGLAGLALLLPGRAVHFPWAGQAAAEAPARQNATAVSLDVTKTARIERPATLVVENRSAAVPTRANFINPRVRPGRICWHPTFTAACDAARKSGKPVLLFQMMGQLDDQFC